MSSISSPLPSTGLTIPQTETRILSATAETAETSEVAVSYTPQWLVPTLGSSPRFEMLGLSSPRSSADVATLIAQTALSLDVAIDDGRKKDAVAKLSALAGALAQFGTATAEKTMIETTDSQARVDKTRTAFDTDTAKLATERGKASGPAQAAVVDGKIQNARIDTLDRRIADLRADLVVTTPDSDRGKAIVAEIAALGLEKTDLSSSLQTAQSRIATLEVSVGDWQARIDAEAAKETPDPALIADYTAKRDESQTSLTAAYEDLASAASTGVASDKAELRALGATKAGEATAAVSALGSLLRTASAFAQASAAQYGAEKSRDDLSNAGQDAATDGLFQDISIELKAAASRLTAIRDRSDAELDAGVSAAAERAGNTALAIMASLASVIAALSGVADAASKPEASTGARPRLRIEA